MKYSFTCTCGDVMTVEADNKQEGIKKLKVMMGEKEIARHMQERHPGEDIPPVGQVHATIDQGIVEV